ncbi:MAG: ACT domain protein [Candidatus Methanomethylophilus sp.]|nr:ACT domain protein [Methanomethylophilus sp.]
MKSWEFTKIENNRIKIDSWLSDAMGLVDGGCVYSTLFKYPEAGPKRYELILSMYPQENFRTLAQVTVFAEDVPGSTVQSAKFLTDQKIRILNSVSLTGISDTTIIWNILADLNFAGEGELIKERFAELKESDDPSVDKINHISIKPANIGRMFREKSDLGNLKTELRKGAPVTFTDGSFDNSTEYGDILNDVDGQEVMITLDPGSWLVSIVFFKPNTNLVKINLNVPDCMGSIDSALSMLAEVGINLISVFTKVMISYQTMDIEVVADLKDSKISIDELKTKLPEHLSKQNGIFELKGIQSLL